MIYRFSIRASRFLVLAQIRTGHYGLHFLYHSRNGFSRPSPVIITLNKPGLSHYSNNVAIDSADLLGGKFMFRFILSFLSVSVFASAIDAGEKSKPTVLTPIKGCLRNVSRNFSRLCNRLATWAISTWLCGGLFDVSNLRPFQIPEL